MEAPVLRHGRRRYAIPIRLEAGVVIPAKKGNTIRHVLSKHLHLTHNFLRITILSLN